MRLVTAVIVSIVLAGGGLFAQRGGGMPAAGPAPTCPAGGYMPQAYYALFGQNGGDGNTSYEIASPCIGKDVRDVAESIGMGRSKLLGVKNVIGVQFKVDGTMADGAGMAKLAGTEFQMAYYLPAMRLFVNGTRANGQPLKDIRVFADQYAWNETEEGRSATAAMNTLNDRLPLLKLTPFGALWSLIEAEGTVKVTTDAQGHTILQGTSPYDGIDVSMTIDHVQHHPTRLGPYMPDEVIHLPIAVTAKANGHTWSATFDDYYGDPSTTQGNPNYLEPSVWMVFPRHLTWMLDGKPYADLHVTYFRSNPYIVFPIPEAVARLAPPRPALNLPASAQRTGNLPLRDVAASYRPVGLRVSPQDGLVMQQHSTEPTPRDANGHPDLSGNWGANFPNPFGGGGLRRRGSLEPDQASMQRGAQWNKPLYKPEYWEKVRSLDFSKSDVDPAYGCGKPVGVPRQNVPGRIDQKSDQIWLLNSVDNALRILPLGKSARTPQDPEYQTFNGEGDARWDGDTLVVESVGFNDVSWLGWEGYFHTDKMKVTERFRRQGDLLFYTFTVDDPEVLMEPWTSYTYVRKLNPNGGRQEEAGVCDERDINLLGDPYLRG